MMQVEMHFVGVKVEEQLLEFSCKQEVLNMLLESARVRIEQHKPVKQKKGCRQSASKTKAQIRLGTFSAPEVLTGDYFKIAFCFKPVGICCHTILKKSDSNYQPMRLYPEKLVAFVQHQTDQPTDVSSSKTISAYFKDSGEKRSDANSFKVTTEICKQEKECLVLEPNAEHHELGCKILMETTPDAAPGHVRLNSLNSLDGKATNDVMCGESSADTNSSKNLHGDRLKRFRFKRFQKPRLAFQRTHCLQPTTPGSARRRSVGFGSRSASKSAARTPRSGHVVVAESDRISDPFASGITDPFVSGNSKFCDEDVLNHSLAVKDVASDSVVGRVNENNTSRKNRCRRSDKVSDKENLFEPVSMGGKSVKRPTVSSAASDRNTVESLDGVDDDDSCVIVDVVTTCSTKQATLASVSAPSGRASYSNSTETHQTKQTACESQVFRGNVEQHATGDRSRCRKLALKSIRKQEPVKINCAETVPEFVCLPAVVGDRSSASTGNNISAPANTDRPLLAVDISNTEFLPKKRSKTSLAHSRRNCEAERDELKKVGQTSAAKALVGVDQKKTFWANVSEEENSIRLAIDDRDDNDDRVEVIDVDELFDGQGHEHDGPVDVDEINDNCSQTLKNILSVQNIRDLSGHQLRYLVMLNEDYLRQIFQGKTTCNRHVLYRNGGKDRRALSWILPVGVFEYEQYEQILSALVELFCKRHDKYFDYVMRVLLPEMLVKVVMHLRDIDYKKAEKLLFDQG